MTTLALIPVQMTVQEFLAWEPGDGRAWQLVDGEPQAMSPASVTHGILLAEIGCVIGNHLHAQDSPCWTVMMAGVVPHVNAGMNFRVADLAVTCTEYQDEQFALADPLLIVEILSPSNHHQTWANVWAYATVPSVREILVLKSAAIGAEVLRRAEDGNWPMEPESLAGGDLVLESIGLRLTVADVYARTPLGR